MTLIVLVYTAYKILITIIELTYPLKIPLHFTITSSFFPYSLSDKKFKKQSFNFFLVKKLNYLKILYYILDFESLINLLLIGLKSLPIIEKFKLFSIIEFRNIRTFNIRIFNDLIINSIIQKCKCFGRVTLFRNICVKEWLFSLP